MVKCTRMCMGVGAWTNPIPHPVIVNLGGLRKKLSGARIAYIYQEMARKHDGYIETYRANPQLDWKVDEDQGEGQVTMVTAATFARLFLSSLLPSPSN